MKHEIEPSKILLIISLFLILSGILNGVFVISEIYRNKNDVNTVNGLALIRGGIQRVVKLEINGIRNDALISEIDNTFDNAVINKEIFDLSSMNKIHK